MYAHLRWTKPKANILFVLIIGLVFGYTVGYVVMLSGRFQFRHHSHEDNELYFGSNLSVGSHLHNEEFHRMENKTNANNLYNNVRVLCWVLTMPQNHQTKAQHIKATWGKKCNILLFMSSKEDESLPAIALSVKESHQALWGKTKEAFKHVYNHYYDQADWFLKTDDDTYMVMENLRYMLSPYKSNEPMYFGCKFKQFTKQGYMIGSSGYVLSQEALRRFVKVGLPNQKACKPSIYGAEDVELGKCLENINVIAKDSRDSVGRGRFLPLSLKNHLIPGENVPSWYLTYQFYNESKGMDCCSDSAIAFHLVQPKEMYVMEYFLYHLRPFGINYNFNQTIE